MKEEVKLILATIAIMAVLIFASIYLYKPTLDDSKVGIAEQPLLKNAKLSIKPNEKYLYNYDLNGTNITATYGTGDGNGCIVIKVLEHVDDLGVCVDENGIDQVGSNTSLGSQEMLLFKPWMLALTENWKWNASLYAEIGGGRAIVSTTTYKLLRMDSYLGRKVFVVEERADNDQNPQYEWIDYERRIALRITGTGYDVTLTSLPVEERKSSSVENNVTDYEKIVYG